MKPRGWKVETESWALVLAATVLVAGNAWGGLAVPGWVVLIFVAIVGVDVLQGMFAAGLVIRRLAQDHHSWQTGDLHPVCEDGCFLETTRDTSCPVGAGPPSGGEEE